MNTAKVLVIAGPTAVGKTEYAIRARKYNIIRRINLVLDRKCKDCS